MCEEFRIISDYPNYEVSNIGNVRNRKTGKLLKPSKHNRGYLKVDLSDAKKKLKSFLIHRLVATAFIPNPDNKKEVNHIDGRKSNNCVENLEWVTHQGNQSHAFKTQLASNEYKRKKVRCIENNKIFPSITSVSDEYNVSKTYVSQSIKNGYSIQRKYHFELI